MWSIRLALAAFVFLSACAVGYGQQKEEAVTHSDSSKLDEILARLDSLERRLGDSRPERRQTQATPRRSWTGAVSFEQAGDQHVYPQVYNVGDLVLPLKSTPASRGELADFDSLIHQITSQIKPETWQLAGGPAAVESFPTNLSIVVSQTHEGHEQLARFLAHLRIGARMAERQWLKQLERRMAELEQGAEK